VGGGGGGGGGGGQVNNCQGLPDRVIATRVMSHQ